MLAKLFNSQAKVKVLQFFLSNPDIVITPLDVAKKTRMSGASARSACTQLAKLEVLKKGEILVKTTSNKKTSEKTKTGYTINTSFPLYKEIQSLFIKSQLLFEGDLVKKMQQIGGAVYIVLTGVFTDPDKETITDLLVVGKVNRDKLGKIINGFERKLGFEINYTLMSRSEYSYRRDITDRFLYSILEDDHIIILDKLYGNN